MENFAKNAEFSWFALQGCRGAKSCLQCYFRELCIFDKVFPSLFSQFAPVQILWLRLAAPGLGDLATLR